MSSAISFSPHALTGFDWLLVVVVAISTLLAFRRGIIRVLFSLAGLVVGVVLAGWEYLRLASWLGRWIVSVPAAQIVAFLAIVLGTTIVASILATVVRRTARAVGLGFVDRLLGALFGLVRGLLLGVAVLLAMAAFVPGSGWVKNSVLAPYFLGGAHAVSFVVPRHLKEQVAAGSRLLLQKSPEMLNINRLDR